MKFNYDEYLGRDKYDKMMLYNIFCPPIGSLSSSLISVEKLQRSPLELLHSRSIIATVLCGLVCSCSGRVTVTK